jgi:PhoPQ-activated pathogenicity-related protein
VRGIIPVSFDMLNIEQQIARDWAAYGGSYAPALADYTAPNLFCEAKATPAGKRLFAIIDPYAYRERLAMPKLIINSAGDQYFVPDASQLYYRQLSGDNRLRYTFNTDHSQAPIVKDLLLRAVAWFNDVKRSRSPPRYDWEVRNGRITVTTTGSVKSVWLWQATDAQQADTRDFRLQTLGPAWTRQPLQAIGKGRYEAPLTVPAPGTWTAQSVEIVFENKSGLLDRVDDVINEASVLKNRQVFTTEVIVRPRRLPRDPATQCTGS